MQQYKPWVLSAPGVLGFHVNLEDPATQAHFDILLCHHLHVYSSVTAGNLDRVMNLGLGYCFFPLRRFIEEKKGSGGMQRV